ncbi:MAG: biotin--[acetyl-CoA-carboxylase] ligase [Flavobacteriales bacterium]|jgi:BirA family biotin operon repressor/biotin-[acetyl-CoA-carboxylase] ligase|nr:biotin--[acetyl-CoA-carboxylase] ligase [Flavobacteriales bacterium]
MDSKPTIGHRVIRLTSVDSTNNYAATGLARQELPHGTAIMALEQTAGRGQRGREWTTAPGLDLAASVVLLPEHFPAHEQFALAKAAALAVHDVVADALVQARRDAAEVRIKWPNDVLIGREKVAGILIVNELKGHWLTSSIVGIGINVNSTGLPEELAATSLVQETRTVRELDGLLAQLCMRMEHWWSVLVADPDAVAGAYTDRLWARGRFATFTLDGAEFTARPLDVDAAGRLIVEDEEGRTAAYGLERLRSVR